MATRIQGLILGLGVDSQADIATASTVYHRFTKLNANSTSPNPMFENDAPEIGKGSEFATNTFPSHWEVSNTMDKYSTAEWSTYAIAYGLGNVTEATGLYTIVPIDPGTTLELPYFSVCEQLAEGGGEAFDNLFVGCSVEDWTYSFSNGPGRASSKCVMNWKGSGLLTQPSAITVPAYSQEHNMLAASITATINSVDYVTAKTLLSGSIAWKNNLMDAAGFFPGSGLQSGLQVKGRQEIGARQPSFTFTVRLLSTSTEYTKLLAQTAGSATVKVAYDSTHYVQFEFASIKYEAVKQSESDGIVTVVVTGLPLDNGTDPVLTVTTKCGLTGIAQPAA